jgi:hypothetical protein
MNGKVLNNSTLPNGLILYTRKREHMYMMIRRIRGTLPGSSTVVELERHYEYVKPAEVRTHDRQQ